MNQDSFDEPIANPLKLRKRTMPEILEYFSNNYPDISFGFTIFQKSVTVYAASEGREDTSYRIDDLNMLTSMLAFVISDHLNQS